MNRWLTCFLYISTIVIVNSTEASVPVDNPVATRYNDEMGYPAWTDDIKWNRVIDMSAYQQGSNDFERFENARDDLYAQGGGVLYYPGGTYNFSDMPADGPEGKGLMLKSGVVIRGEAPQNDSDASDGSLTLSTRFEFGFQTKGGGDVPRDWNFVGMVPGEYEELSDIDNIGIAWVHLVGATIYWGPDIQWGDTWESAGSWKSSKAKQNWGQRVPDGTHPLDPFAGGTKQYRGVGYGRLVMGCILQDAAVLNDAIDEGAGASGFYMDKFGARIAVYGSRVFVANNVLPQSSKNFAYTQTICNTDTRGGCSKVCDGTPEEEILFDYGKTCGIDINKTLLGYTDGNDGLLEPGVTVIDNYVYNHGNKGFDIAGKWVVIRNNHNERDYLQSGQDPYGIGGWVLTLDGWVKSTAGGPGCISDNLSRAYDLAGQNLWVDENYYNNTGSNPGNDGEGILCQSWAGTQIWSWAFTSNYHEKGVGDNGYIGGYDVEHMGALFAWNTTAGSVGSINNKSKGLVDCAFVQNQADLGTKTSSAAGQPEDVITECPSQSPAPPADIQATVNDGDHVVITWSDNSQSEIGFRVDRKMGSGNWNPIAYRPRKSFGTDYNAQSWADFNAPSDCELFYRVVAINCDDNDEGASEAVGPLTINESTTSFQSRNERFIPLMALVRVSGSGIEMIFQKPTRLNELLLWDLRGRKIATKRFKGLHTRAELIAEKLSGGTYLLTATTETGKFTERFTIK